jgi:F-type H+-transporting ATPase subunit gamma
MAALKDIRRKINAVHKTRQITRAMNMVAASKFRTAQTRMTNFRPYSESFMEMLNELAGGVGMEAHPLMTLREPRKIRVLVLTSDRGLCGGFNNNLIKAAERFIAGKRKAGLDVDLLTIGKKGRDYFKKHFAIVRSFIEVLGRFDMSLAVAISDEIIPPFLEERCDEFYVIYNEFVNVSVHKPKVLKLLPLASLKKSEEDRGGIEYIYEPSAKEILEKLLPMHVHVTLYRALVETSAGEHGARMAAMDNATRNCEDMIESLTLRYNKARQAAITSELMDIVGGTEALSKG